MSFADLILWGFGAFAATCLLACAVYAFIWLVFDRARRWQRVVHTIGSPFYNIYVVNRAVVRGIAAARKVQRTGAKDEQILAAALIAALKTMRSRWIWWQRYQPVSELTWREYWDVEDVRSDRLLNEIDRVHVDLAKAKREYPAEREAVDRMVASVRSLVDQLHDQLTDSDLHRLSMDIAYTELHLLRFKQTYRK